MTEYVVAKKYESGIRVGEPYDKGGKLYTKIKVKCDRCVNGVYACGVENGQIKPHPAYGGVCLKCGGVGYAIHEARLYTPKEKEQMERANKRARERREAERQAEIEKSFAKNKEEWLAKNEFDEDGYTYIITGDSYSIREELKHAGWKFDPVILWHKANPAGYEERVIKVHVDQLFTFTAWGKGMYKEGCADTIKLLLKETKEPSNSEWIGTPNEKLEGLHVIVKSKGGFEGRFGYTNIYRFETPDGNKLTWFTTTNFPAEEGDAVDINATVKSHDTYDDEKITIITRVKVV